MNPIAIIKLGETYPDLAARIGGFADWVAAGLTAPKISTRVVDITAGAPLPGLSDISGAVLTGSHDMLTEPPDWNDAAAAWLKSAVTAGIPVLGICYGHQLLAHAFGGRVGNNPRGREFGTTMVHLSPAARTDPLMGHLPEMFPAHVCHRQSVVGIPEAAVVLASNPHDPAQALRIGPSAWGVQFHPEFPDAAMRTYITVTASDLAGEGQRPEELLSEVSPTPAANGILHRFSELVAERCRG